MVLEWGYNTEVEDLKVVNKRPWVQYPAREERK
jgi:hypothetical protein